MKGRFFRDLLSSITDKGRSLLNTGDDRPASGKSLLELSEAILSERGEASGVALARQALDAFAVLPKGERAPYFSALAARFGPDHGNMQRAARDYLANPDGNMAAVLRQASEPRRQELIRRLNMAPNGTAGLVAMRADLIGLLPDHPELQGVDRDFDHLLSSWFNRGFLILEQIDWSTPASILEKIIRYEAVHEIQSWNDLRRRIEPRDRRCYAFFHPALVDEPLIFVEVALTKGIPGAIGPILAADREELPEAEADTAVFYSISNCQKGLRGVSFGNFLIKQVVEELAHDQPQLKTFVTLSPAPGFRRWLTSIASDDPDELLSAEDREVLGHLDNPDWRSGETAAALQDTLQPLCAYYYLHAKRRNGLPVDPVARFHLGNGARLERINWLADTSETALDQAAGFMVNYLYDLKSIEKNHEAFAKQQQVAASGAVTKLLKHKPKAKPTAKSDETPSATPQTTRSGPLDGLLVLDLTRVLAGPYATMVLADLGAEVIKIERPDGGDDARQFGPFVNGKSAYFMSLNRGKKSIALDLKAEADRGIFEHLVAKADVLVENYRAGTMHKLGYGWEALQAINPRLVYAAVSGFGQTGPYKDRAAYDMVVQAMGGIMSVTGHPDASPTRVGTSIGDITAGLFGATGILAALNDRQRTGKGAMVDVAMLDSQVAILENAIGRYLAENKIPQPLGARHPSITPFDAFHARDGFLVIAAGNQVLFEKLCNALARPDLIGDPDFATNDDRTRNNVRLKSEIEAALAERTAAEWLDTLEAAGVPCGPINNLEQVVADPHIVARNMIVSAEDSEAGTVRMAGNPVKIAAYDDPGRRPPAPDLDADRDAILKLIS